MEPNNDVYRHGYANESADRDVTGYGDANGHTISTSDYDGNSYRHADMDRIAERNCHLACGCDCYIDAQLHPNGDRGSDFHRNCRRRRHGHSDGCANPDGTTHADTHGDCWCYDNLYRNADRIADTDGDAATNANSNRNSDGGGADVE